MAGRGPARPGRARRGVARQEQGEERGLARLGAARHEQGMDHGRQVTLTHSR
jgi:hypothetical protein